jgi:N-methylhydantoinase A/oxoprolinase/acetone carboxylase beta subunit
MQIYCINGKGYFKMTLKINSARYGIGVDTGGTFTDAVLLDLKDHKVLKSSKHPTTHHRLLDGIFAAMTDVLSDVDYQKIKKIAFSTTLATNAVVENRGAGVGLLIIGHMKSIDLPVVSVRYIDGGHDHMGREVKPLELEKLVDAITEVKGHVDTYVVAAAMSIENPIHEQVAAKAIELADNCPVFCSHQVSQKPGIAQRAATAVMHARLMPVIKEFVTNVQHLPDTQSPMAKMQMIRGDASSMDLDKAVFQAANTVASGPAATAAYGAAAVPSGRVLVVDVGGTTTDMALVENGQPHIATDGGLIGGLQTHIDTVDTDTVGIGGDSLVKINRFGKIELGPGRVHPLATVDQIPDPARWLGQENRSRCIMAQDSDTASCPQGIPILTYLKEYGPACPQKIAEAIGFSELNLDRRLEDLNFKGQIKEIGFTPTDALCALGKIRLGNPERSLLGAKILAEIQSKPVEEFCREVLLITHKKISHAIVDYLFRKQAGRRVDNSLYKKDNSLFNVSFKLNIPIVGIGAAAEHLLPQVAQTLQTEVIFPADYQVGNAVGAIKIAAGD